MRIGGIERTSNLDWMLFLEHFCKLFLYAYPLDTFFNVNLTVMGVFGIRVSVGDVISGHALAKSNSKQRARRRPVHHGDRYRPSLIL